ncbi:hypothetical protein WOLCODRAFT_17334 [Wolfiporia cocos MD-104 SS10]|uniref:Uncharacterized protein n=1 Tax=Wolfiporia cocos (strain MD-104) TaxID=742152 RepID=A0A2H3JHX3_WOLCO|nr:hypothetical protein WOLCODRAFT_17334 [Wolfiporia cocos MD-104 SS10]
MAASTSTGRHTRTLSRVVLSSSSSGRMTLPLVDPATGKLEHYTLVKIDAPSSPAEPATDPRDALPPSASLPSILELEPRQENPLAQRLARLVSHYLLDVSPRALCVLEEDTAWPCLRLAPGRPTFLPATPPSPALKACPSLARFASPTPSSTRSAPLSQSASPTRSASPPPLVHDQEHEHDQSLSRDDSFFAFADTPAHPPAPTHAYYGWPGSEPDSSFGARALVGLGLVGMTKADGTPFDGLGLLPRSPFPPFSPDHYWPAAADCSPAPAWRGWGALEGPEWSPCVEDGRAQRRGGRERLESPLARGDELQSQRTSGFRLYRTEGRRGHPRTASSSTDAGAITNAVVPVGRGRGMRRSVMPSTRRLALPAAPAQDDVFTSSPVRSGTVVRKWGGARRTGRDEGRQGVDN